MYISENFGLRQMTLDFGVKSLRLKFSLKFLVAQRLNVVLLCCINELKKKQQKFSKNSSKCRLRRNVPRRSRSLKIILIEIDTRYISDCHLIYLHCLCVKGVSLKDFGNLIVAPKFSAMSELLPNGHHFVLRFTPGFTTVRKLLAFIYI